ncbi:venom protease [Tribolium castaneum]|uniref:Serine protease P141 n=1 Tax=Tribolium castaneum TaxID=7070 RepID=D6WLM9_TRICA|nr:PREDICTED: venom protease [Tribolium castaneum]EFA04602.2 serine protease P141 [Tribolium castaneum]|eukprot:XP_971578.1 PREDICTED: venom protease [Tribolium castaneum]
MDLLVLTWFFSLLLTCSTLQYEGEKCAVPTTNESGVCISVHSCEYARQLLKEGGNPQFCGFKGNDALVCCPVNQRLVTKTSGEKSRKLCSRQYDKKWVYYAIDLGKKALSKEFPHMAAIGYGDNIASIVWLCGGTLISQQFILTAAHCLFSRDFGPATWVRIGDLDLKNDTEDADPNDLRIIKTFAHPKYKSSSHYHDIALLQLEKNVTFGSYYKPACLHLDNSVPTSLEAIGWGKVGVFGDPSSHLMKVGLEVVNYQTCAKRYSDVSKTKLKDGIVDGLQLCAGDVIGGDTCPGDSGGPLHYRFNETDDMVKHFVVVGVTSFGKGCGGENSIGVYTRVSGYIDWIESIVWP